MMNRGVQDFRAKGGFQALEEAGALAAAGLFRAGEAAVAWCGVVIEDFGRFKKNSKHDDNASLDG